MFGRNERFSRPPARALGRWWWLIVGPIERILAHSLVMRWPIIVGGFRRHDNRRFFRVRRGLRIQLLDHRIDDVHVAQKRVTNHKGSVAGFYRARYFR